MSANRHLKAEDWLRTPALTMDKLPVLNSVFERMAPACAEQLRNLCPLPVTFFLNQAETGNSWDVLEKYDDSVAVIFNVPEWDARLLFGIDRRFIFTLVEALYGGDMGESEFEAMRPFTPLEARIGKMVCHIAATVFQSCFAPVASISLIAERAETSLDFTVLGQASFPVVTAQLLFQVGERGGRMFLLLPQAPLIPMRQRLQNERQALSAGVADEPWLSTLRTRVTNAGMTLEASLRGEDLTLLDVARFKPGLVLGVHAAQGNRVVLQCEGERLFEGTLGQSGGFYTLELNAPYNAERDFIGDVMAGTNAA
jgi:flagellar motor switch protein FliM